MKRQCMEVLACILPNQSIKWPKQKYCKLWLLWLKWFQQVIVTKQDLAVLHLNISSLSSHINELKLLLSSSNLNFDIICITESRITKSNLPTSNIHIPGYSIEQTPIESSAGGKIDLSISKTFLQKQNWPPHIPP